MTSDDVQVIDLDDPNDVQVIEVDPAPAPPLIIPAPGLPLLTNRVRHLEDRVDDLERHGPPSTGPSRHVHTQGVPSDTWIVDHGLGRRPVAWSLYDADGMERGQYRVEHPTLNRAVVRMDTACAGTITLI